MNKYGNLKDDELYMLKRQAIESSWNIVMSGNYTKEEIQIHNNLLNGILDEIIERKKEEERINNWMNNKH